MAKMLLVKIILKFTKTYVTSKDNATYDNQLFYGGEYLSGAFAMLKLQKDKHLDFGFEI